MKYKVVVSDKAKRQLGQHVRFLANVDKGSAAKTKARFLKAFHSLAEMPQRYPFLDDPLLPKNKYHKMFVENWYLILYQIRDDTVFIEYCIDCRQEYGWLK